MTTTTVAKYTGSDLLVAILLSPGIFLFRAYVLSMLWLWYAVPMLGVPPLRMVFAFGILCIVAFLKGADVTDDRTTSMPTLVMITIVTNSVSLLVGYIGTFFI